MLPAAAIEPTSPAVTALLLASKFLMDAGLVLTLGLLTTAIALPNDAGALRTAARSLLRSSRATAAVTATATLAFAFATTADVMGVGLAEVARSLSFFESLLAQTSLGHSMLWQLGLLLGYGLLCQFTARVTSALLLLPVLLGVVVARASTGHSGNSAWHMAAIEAWAIHIGALCVWMGVIAVVAWRGRSAGDDLAAPTLQRLSELLRTCMILVLLSGTASALVRLTRPMDLLTSRYGALLTAKVALSVALVAGFTTLLRRTDADRARGRWLTLHLLGLTLTTAVAVVLSRTAPPFDPDAGIGDFSPLRQSLGFAPPPAPTPADILWAQSRPDVFWLLVAALGAWAYLRGARTLRRRGDTWSRGRTAAWLAGLATLTYATSGPLGTYGHIFFSAHMAQHLLLVMVAPLLLVAGAPMTLALRALPANRAQTGAREWLLVLLHSRYTRIAAHPLVSFANFVGGFFILYFSGAFEALMRSHAGHLLMQAHFLASGYLFFLVVIGADPAPRQLPAPARAGLALLAAPFHAVFSVIVMQGNAVLAAGYFTPLAAAYKIDPLHDQYVGSSLGWAFGEVPMVVAIVIAVTRWVRADAREAARFDKWDDEQRARGETAERASAAE